MTIDFYIPMKNREDLSGLDLIKDFETYREELLSKKRLSGSLIITSEASTCVIEDELAPLISNLCLESLPMVVHGGKSRFLLFEIHGYVEIETVDEFLMVKSDYSSEIIVTRKEFLLLAYKCAERYLAFLQLLNDPRRNDDVAILSSGLASASEAK